MDTVAGTQEYNGSKSLVLFHFSVMNLQFYEGEEAIDLCNQLQGADPTVDLGGLQPLLFLRRKEEEEEEERKRGRREEERRGENEHPWFGG